MKFHLKPVAHGVLLDPAVRAGCLSRCLQLFGIAIPVKDYSLSETLEILHELGIPLSGQRAGIRLIPGTTTTWHATVFLPLD